MPRPRSWTDDDLREAVAASTTYKEVTERLGLSSGSSHTAIRVRIAELGIDDGHLRRAARLRKAEQARARAARQSQRPDPGGTRSWTDDQLRASVAAAANLKQVFDGLGLVPGGSQWQRMQDHIERLGLSTEHWTAPLPRNRGRGPRWGDADLVTAVADATSLAQVLRALGVRGGGSQAVVRRRIEQLGLDTTHFTGQAWASGIPNPSGRRGKPLDEVLVVGSTYRNSSLLKRRLIEEGRLQARCAICGLEEWQGRPAPLHLDHVNGDRRDNRIENLRVLCPNCHALTETYAGRNQGRYAGPPG